MAQTLRIGVAGLGRAGAGMLAAMLAHPDVEVTAAADLHQAHRDAFASEIGGAAYPNVEGLAADPNVDAIYIATPHQFHADHVEIAAAAGKHLIVEKPVALSLEECDRIIAACERAGVHLVVGHTASFNPAVVGMRKLVTSGDVGGVAMISATAYTDFLYRPRRPEELVTAEGGGIMYNQVPHQVDAARYVTGGLAKSVRAITYVLDPARPTEGSYMGLLTFENGAAASLVYSGYDHFDSTELATGKGKEAERYGAARRALAGAGAEEEVARRIDTGFGGGHRVSMGGGGSHLQGELGSFVVTCEQADLRLLPGGIGVYTTDGFRLVEPEAGRGVPGRGAVIDELYHAVTADAATPHDGRWAKATMEVCLAMLESGRGGHEISLRHQVALQEG